MLILWISIISMLASNSLAIALDKSTLKFVQIMVRHGFRSPRHYLYLPTDPESLRIPWYDSKNGKGGEISKKGIYEAYSVGKYLSDRYGFLVNYTYDASELFVVSGEENRTLTSALALLAGMFPPNSNQIWNRELNWQPIPVHTAKYIDSNRVLTSCPLLSKSLEENRPFQDKLKSLESITNFITLKSGFGENVRPLVKVINILDNLKIREMDNKTHPLPKWANQMPRNFSFVNLFAKILWGIYSEPDVLRAVSGLYVYHFVSEITQHIQKENAHKFFISLVHDVDLMAIAKALKLKNFNTKNVPNVACHLSVELHQIDENYYVQIWYRDDLAAEQQFFPMSSCPDPCSFDHFKGLIPLLTTDQWNMACSGETKTEQEISHLRIATVILSILCIVLFGLLFFCWLRQRSNQRKPEELPLMINRYN